jgi:hypothetical protein
LITQSRKECACCFVIDKKSPLDPKLDLQPVISAMRSDGNEEQCSRDEDRRSSDELAATSRSALVRDTADGEEQFNRTLRSDAATIWGVMQPR